MTLDSSNTQPAAPNLLVNARDIGVRLGERWIIRHVDLKVAPGELVYIIGANGAGKSTCVKAVLGLIDITEGRVARAPSLEVGYVPQRLQVTPTLPMTLRRLMTLTGRFPADRIDSALAAVGLERLGDPPVTELVGGRIPAADAGAGADSPARSAGPRRTGTGRRCHRNGRRI